MDAIINFIEVGLGLDLGRILHSIIVVLVSILIYQIFRQPAKHVLGLSKHKTSNTYLSMIGSIVRTVYISVVVLFVLQINGVDVTNVIAGLGIVSVVMGLAIQDTLKDIIRGVTIVSDDYYKVGEYVTIDDISGTVIAVGIRSTKIRDEGTGAIVTIANRNIETAQTAGLKFGIDVPLPYNLKVEKAEAILNEIATRCMEFDEVHKLEYVGVNELTDNAIIYKLFGSATPRNKLMARRRSLREVLVVLEEHKLSVPYPQLDVHQK